MEAPAGPRFALVTCRIPGEDRTRAGVLRGDVVYLPSALEGFSGVLELVERWGELAGRLRTLDPGSEPVRGARILAPLRFPRKMLFAGANYHSHAAEMGVGDGASPATPFFFMKPPSTTVIGPGEAILVEDDPEQRVDWEAELAVVIGRRARALSAEEALEAVAGYTALNDVSARGCLRRPTAASEAFQWDWLASKGRDTFCPLGPGVVPAWEIPDPQRLRIRLWVNGALKQDASTEDMIVPVAELVAAASRIVTLEPGDVIGTGTPAGVGAPRGEWLRPGDLVRIEVEGVGRLENPVVTAARNRGPAALSEPGC